jgi:predicted alpha/beta hydrolase family esterase
MMLVRMPNDDVTARRPHGTPIERIVVVPRWGGTPDDDWYPHLVANVADGVDVEFVPLLPTPAEPRIADGDAALAAALAGVPLESTLLVGHSVGCQLVLRHLATRRRPGELAHVLLVAAWWTVDEPWPTIMPYIDEPIDAAAVRAVAPRVDVLLSDNDPFTSDHETAATRFREQLGSTVHLAPGDEHFNRAIEPRVDRLVRDLLGVAPGVGVE